MPRLLLVLLIVAVAAVPCLAELSNSDMIPFVIPAKPNPDSLIARPASPPITTDSPRIVARDGHFYRAENRVRFLGVNFTFSAAFPTHEAAEDVALRLSQAGINCVRFHHMDTSDWSNHSGIWDPNDRHKLSPEALDRLDYLLHQLALRGIYANINLHVGRIHSKTVGLPTVAGVDHDKMIDIFTPQLIAAQREYATQLLTHINPYRKVRYADDPLIAIVEINNEDSLFMWGAKSRLPKLPAPYSSILKDQFNDWLKFRYTQTPKLQAAWGKGAMALGEELLVDRDFATIDQSDRRAWPLEVHPDHEARLTRPADNIGVRIQITKADSTDWHLQFQQPLKLNANTYYTLEYTARADQNRKITASISQAHDPWRNLGLSDSVALTPQWQTFRAGLTVADADDKARLSFIIGGNTTAVEFKNISLRVGGRDGLAQGESLELHNVELFTHSTTPARENDTYRFLAETEKAYYDNFRGFIQKDLGCKAMVTGTIVFGPLGLWAQSDMDFIDAHAYWQHPQFPGKAWDMNNWLIEQKAMVDRPTGATLFELGTERLAGKPFTVTEYCHPAPNDYQAECVPEIATFGAAQDWDALFFFDYGSVPSTDKIGGFFSFGDNPSKWGFMPAAAVIFREGGLPPLAASRLIRLYDQTHDPMPKLISLYQTHDLNLFAACSQNETQRLSKDQRPNFEWPQLLITRIAISLRAAPSPNESPATSSPSIDWKTQAKTGNYPTGTYTTRSPAVYAWIGRIPSAQSSPDPNSKPTFIALTMTSLDGMPFATSKKILITACGRAENLDMGFAADRRSVGRNWGRGPVQIEAPTITLETPATLTTGKWNLVALSPDGRPLGDPVEIILTPGQTFKVGDHTKSMWYLLTR